MAYQSYTKENKFSDEFKEECRLHGAYAVSTVSSLYMAGQPDLSITSKLGQETKAELKIYRGVSLPTRDNIINLLRGPQVNVITNQMFRRNANCIVIAQIGAKLDTCCILSKHKISFALWKEAAKIVAILPFGHYTPWQE